MNITKKHLSRRLVRCTSPLFSYNSLTDRDIVSSMNIWRMTILRGMIITPERSPRPTNCLMIIRMSVQAWGSIPYSIINNISKQESEQRETYCFQCGQKDATICTSTGCTKSKKPYTKPPSNSTSISSRNLPKRPSRLRKLLSATRKWRSAERWTQL